MSRRGLLTVLVISLAINLFVLGGLAGAALMGFRLHGGPFQPGGPPRLAAMAPLLAPEHRDAWRALLRDTGQGSVAKLRQARALRREAWRGLTADPADPQAALAALRRSRALEFDARSEMDRAVVTFAATLPAPERQRLAEALSRFRPRSPARPGSGGGAGPHGSLGGAPDR